MTYNLEHYEVDDDDSNSLDVSTCEYQHLGSQCMALFPRVPESAIQAMLGR